jgi:hypothetical protein
MDAPDIDPVAMLIAAGDCAARGQALPPLVGAWLAAGVKAYLGGEVSLDRALTLAGDGWPGSTRHRYRLRNEALRAAFDLVGNDPAALAREVDRFASRTWPRWRHLDQPPGRATAVEVELFAAFAACPRIPASAKQLARICRPE